MATSDPEVVSGVVLTRRSTESLAACEAGWAFYFRNAAFFGSVHPDVEAQVADNHHKCHFLQKKSGQFLRQRGGISEIIKVVNAVCGSPARNGTVPLAGLSPQASVFVLWAASLAAGRALWRSVCRSCGLEVIGKRLPCTPGRFT